jgi:dipeptidyl aminopeptidase/acylaminoacyl peptidase
VRRPEHGEPVRGRPATGRLIAAIVTGAVALGAAALYTGARVSEQQRIETTAPSPGTVADLGALLDAPRIVFRSTARDSTYGRLSVVALDAPDGPRASTDVECERVYATAAAGVCLAADRGVVTTYRTLTLDAGLRVTDEAPLTGLPSRARLSPDGSLIATTTFVTGHSYMSSGFSTETVVRGADGTEYGNLEEFTLEVDGAEVAAVDRNFWGVTFVDGDTFFATASSGGTTWLVRGSLSERRLVALREDAECPSVSPDGTRVAYKKRGPAPAGQWRLAVLDLATGEERLLDEERSVDDQIAWVDADTVAYGLPREGADAAVTDVWSLPVDGGEPEVLVPQAWSPAVIG